VVNPGQVYTGQVSAHSYQYYQLHAPKAGISMVVTMTRLSGDDTDPDLYLSSQKNPSTTDYTYRDIGIHEVHQIGVNPDDASTLRWYAGVYGYKGNSSFSIVMNFTCATPCQQGTCNAGICECNAGFGGQFCSVPVALIEPDTVYQGDGILGMWDLYQLHVPADWYEISIIMNSTSINGDPDLYVGGGKPPNALSYDRRYATTMTVTEAVIRPGDLSSTDTVFAGVLPYGSNAGPFSLTFSQYECPQGCSGHGDCNAEKHSCLCHTGWDGEACDVESAALANHAPTDAVIAPGEWQLFFFNVDLDLATATASLEIDVTIPDGAFISLYVRKSQAPTTQVYDYVASIPSDGKITVFISSLELQEITYFVGVHSWGIETVPVTVNRDLIASCPLHCSGHGSCNPDSGICSCSAGYSGIGCESSSNGGGASSSQSSGAPLGPEETFFEKLFFFTSIVLAVVVFGAVAVVIGGLVGAAVMFFSKEHVQRWIGMLRQKSGYSELGPSTENTPYDTF